MKPNSIGYLIKEGIRNIWSNRTMSFASMAVLVSCLLLTGAALMFSMNINLAMQSVKNDNSMTIYLKDGLPTLQAVKVGEEIKKIPNIATCDFVPKDEALQRYMDILGDDGSILNGLQGKDNPLPNAYKISLKDLAKYKETVKQIKALNGINKISDYSEIANKLTSIDHLVTTAGFWIILLLSLVSLFIISNTIRVTMFSRRLEISIMKSVGATNGFIRLPFIVEGITIGIFSGALSSLILNLIYSETLRAVTDLLPTFIPVDINPLMFKITMCFIGAGVLFGAIGGMISITKYLRKQGGEFVG